jgi:predicted ATPase
MPVKRGTADLENSLSLPVVVSVPVSVFVGRGGDLAWLRDAFADPGVQAVLVAGEAGLGKSRLIGEFCARLDPRTVVLTGRCPEFGNDGAAFGPFITVMRALLRQVGAELFISGNTAGVHVSRILTKLDAASRTQAAAIARDHALIP